MRRIFPIFTLLVGVLLMAAPAFAQANCAPRDTMIEALSERFGEVRTGYGLGPGNAVVEVYASPETGTWSIVVTNAGGVSCLVAAGQAWAHVEAAAVPEGDPL